MYTLLFTCVAVTLVCTFIVFVQAMRIMRKHRGLQRHQGFLLEKASTLSAKVRDLRHELAVMRGIHDTDTAMVERLLQEVEKYKGENVELLKRMGRYKILVGQASDLIDFHVKNLDGQPILDLLHQLKQLGK